MASSCWSAFATCLAVVLLSTAGRPLLSQSSGPGREFSRRTGAISGVIGEGASGRELSGVVVSLTDGSAKVSVRTVTDSKGRFVFRGLPSSSGYLLNAAKPGFVSSGLARAFILSDPTRIPLADGEWIPDVRIIMWRLGAITGRVIDENGEPVVDIPVRVLAEIPVAGTNQFASGPAARTDDRGIYRIAGLRHGNYVVTVPSVQAAVPLPTLMATVTGRSSSTVAVGGRQIPKIAGLDMIDSRLVIGNYASPPPPIGTLTRAYPVLFYPNARTVAKATLLTLSDGEEKRHVDFGLQPVSTARITGRVIGPPKLVERVVIRLLPKGSETLGTGFEQATALASADGTFVLVNVPPGEYTLDATPTLSHLSGGSAGTGSLPVSLPSMPGIIRETVPVVTTIPSAPEGTFLVVENGTGNERYSGRLQVAVGSVSIDGLAVTLQPGATISGRIVREDGEPPTGRVGIMAEPADGNPTLGRLQARDVGPTGAFAITGLERGEYLLRAGLVKSIIASDGDHTDRPFEVSAGESITGITVTITDRPATLSGAVRDSHGTPVRDGAVILFPSDRSLWTRFGYDPPRIKAVTFFGVGGYSMARLVQGDYFVVAVPLVLRNAWHDPRFFAAAAPLATRVRLEWGRPTVQNLTIQQVGLK